MRPYSLIFWIVSQNITDAYTHRCTSLLTIDCHSLSKHLQRSWLEEVSPLHQYCLFACVFNIGQLVSNENYSFVSCTSRINFVCWIRCGELPSNRYCVTTDDCRCRPGWITPPLRVWRWGEAMTTWMNHTAITSATMGRGWVIVIFQYFSNISFVQY